MRLQILLFCKGIFRNYWIASQFQREIDPFSALFLHC